MRLACAMRFLTSRACGSGGLATSCTAPTATASRNETASSPCWEAHPLQSDMPRSSASGLEDLVYITPVDSLTATERRQLAARGIGIAEGVAQRVIVEGDRLRGVELDGDRSVACEALFVPPRSSPTTACSSTTATTTSSCTSGYPPDDLIADVDLKTAVVARAGGPARRVIRRSDGCATSRTARSSRRSASEPRGTSDANRRRLPAPTA